jgi:hypothetical protein
MPIAIINANRDWREITADNSLLAEPVCAHRISSANAAAIITP